ISDLIAKNDTHGKIVSIGIGTPGLVDHQLGGVKAGAKNLPGWEGIPFKVEVSQKFKLPTAIDNDANMVTLGEYYFGAGQGTKNMICLTLGTGIGGGIIMDGKLYHGTNNYAAEIGHMSINIEGPKCNCGSYGCLEAYASATAIVARTIASIKKGQATMLTDLVNSDLTKITAKTVTEAAKKGDSLCLEVVKETGKYLGVGVANLINLLNPELVVLAGGVSQAGDIILNPTIHNAQQYSLQYAFSVVKIVLGKLQDAAGIIGAGIYSLENI
ncbi:MAG: ROK family protein, partial [bacterium]